MDSINSKQTQNCFKHPENQIEFIQVNDVSNQQDKSLLYCLECFNEDLSFKGINYLYIQQVIQKGSSNIIQKWPPVNDYQILEKLIQETSAQKQSPSIEQQITNYFTQLKDEILKKIDICQKKMINQAQELPFDNSQIIKKYQEISKIFELRCLLLQDKKEKIESEECYKIFISQIESEKNTNTLKLQNLLNECLSIKAKVNFEVPNTIKESILFSIDQIDFFDGQVMQIDQKTLQLENNLKNVDKIIQLVSNKSNFCSQQFLDSLKQQLQKVNYLFKYSLFENMFEQNKQPINFSDLNIQQLDMIKNYIDHVNEKKNNREYLNEIQNSVEIQQLKDVMNNKTLSINDDFNNQFQEYLIETYPFLKQLKFKNMINKQDIFLIFKDISNEFVNDLLELVKKKIQIQQNNYLKSQTYQIQQQFLEYHNIWCYKNDFENILIKYPIFDLINFKKQRDIMQNIQFNKTNYNQGQQRTVIYKNQNNEIEVYLNETGNTNIISNITLQKDKKYIFRYQIQSLDNNESNYMMIGLIQDKNKELSDRSSDKLSFELKHNKDLKIIEIINNKGIYKQIKGNVFELSKENILEIRISLNEKILEVVDFPNYNYKLEICDEYKQSLIEKQDLKLFIWLCWKNFKVVLKNGFMVNDFDN